MSPRKTRMMRAVALAAGGVLLVTLFVNLGPARILTLLAALGWNVPLILALFLGHEIVRTLALTHWLPTERRPPIVALLRLRLFGEAAGALTRTGALTAEPARAWLLANRGGQGLTGYSAAVGELVANSAASAAVNVVTAGGVLLTAALKGPIVVLAHVLFWASLVHISAVVGIGIARMHVLDACMSGLARLPLLGRRVRFDRQKVRDFEQTIRAAFAKRPSALTRVVLLELSAQFFLVCETYWAIRSMGVALSFSSAVLFEVMTRAFTIVELVGATEMGFAVVFTWLGMPAVIGFTLSLVKTLRSLSAAGIAIALPASDARVRTMRSVAAAIILVVAAISIAGADGRPVSDRQPGLDAVLAGDLHFSAAELADLARGKVVKHTLPPAAPDEIGVAGAVRVRGSRDRLIAAYRDIVSFKKSPAVLEIGRFSDPPRSGDLDALTTGRDDFDLRGCAVAGCDIRLPASGIHHIAANVDWRRPDADRRAAMLFKALLLAHVRAYTSDAPGRITQYDNGRTPVQPVAVADALIRTSPFLDALKPGLAAHVTCFWSNPLDGAEDFLYWTKETFGMAPFISVTHVTIVPSGPHQSVATSRDVYSSRYIDGSLSMMIASDVVGDPGAFYLTYVNRSRTSALRGPLAGLRRSIIEHKAKGSLGSHLRDIKARIEAF